MELHEVRWRLRRQAPDQTELHFRWGQDRPGLVETPVEATDRLDGGYLASLREIDRHFGNLDHSAGPGHDADLVRCNLPNQGWVQLNEISFMARSITNLSHIPVLSASSETDGNDGKQSVPQSLSGSPFRSRSDEWNT